MPTLYDLLLPKRDDGAEAYAAVHSEACGEPVEFRPDTFTVGSREFDVTKIGFRYSEYEGFNFNTDIPGNSNSGHEYGRPAQSASGEIVYLCEDERMAILEYIKTL